MCLSIRRAAQAALYFIRMKKADAKKAAALQANILAVEQQISRLAASIGGGPSSSGCGKARLAEAACTGRRGEAASIGRDQYRHRQPHRARACIGRPQPMGLCSRCDEDWLGDEVRPAGPGRRIGMFAARDLAMGERVLAERPLATWTVRKGESREGKLASFAKVVAGFSASQRSAFLSLSQASHLESGSAGRTMMATWLTNALPINYEENEAGTHEDGAVFATISRINHACDCNCHHEWNAAIGMETIHALRPIACGEELTITYLMPSGRQREERQRLLSEQFGFVCGCRLCSLPPAEVARSDACQRALGDLKPEAMEGGSTSLEERVKRAEVRMRLLEAEGLPIVWARPLLISAMVASVQDKSAKGRERSARPRRAGDCVREGVDGRGPPELSDGLDLFERGRAV